MMLKTKHPINKQRLAVAMATVNLNKSQLAKRLGIRRAQLWRRTAAITAWSQAELYLLGEILKVDPSWLFETGGPIIRFVIDELEE